MIKKNRPMAKMYLKKRNLPGKLMAITTFGLEKLRDTFWKKIPNKTFLKDNKLNTGLSVNDDAILYNSLPFFIKYGDSYLIPKEKMVEEVFPEKNDH